MKHLNHQQLQDITAGLRRQRGQLGAELRTRLLENGHEVGPGLHRYLSDELDPADAAEQFADDLAWLGHEAERLRQTDAALARLAQHRYGVCSRCGQPIPVARLLAMPAADRCLACQQLLEHAYPA